MKVRWKRRVTVLIGFTFFIGAPFYLHKFPTHYTPIVQCISHCR
jgi:hypothetical protein